MTISKDGHYEEADLTDPEVQAQIGLVRVGRELRTITKGTVIHTLDDQELAVCEAKEKAAHEAA